MTERPVTVEPVNASLSTSGCSASAAPASSPSPGTTLKTPGGAAGLQADPAQLEARERCELGCLEDDGVPRCQRRRSLAAGDVEREVPRDDHADHAHRLLAHVVEGRFREREHTAVDRPDEPLVEAPRVPARRKVDERRLADRLADVVALDLREVFLLGLDPLRDAKQDPSAFVRIEVAPCRERSPRCAYRAVDVLGLGGGDLHDRPVRGRVDRRHRLAGGGVHPLAADQKPRLQALVVGQPLDTLFRARHVS